MFSVFFKEILCINAYRYIQNIFFSEVEIGFNFAKKEKNIKVRVEETGYIYSVAVITKNESFFTFLLEFKR